MNAIIPCRLVGGFICLAALVLSPSCTSTSPRGGNSAGGGGADYRNAEGPASERMMADLAGQIWQQYARRGPRGTGLRKLRVSWFDVLNESSYPELTGSLGVFKDELQTSMVQSEHGFSFISDRFVEVGLQEVGIRDADQLMVPAKRRAFIDVMTERGEPIDVMLLARLRSTTASAADGRVRYQLTLEWVDLRESRAGEAMGALTAHVVNDPPSRW